jgi:hypothetical protein
VFRGVRGHSGLVRDQSLTTLNTSQFTDTPLCPCLCPPPHVPFPMSLSPLPILPMSPPPSSPCHPPHPPHVALPILPMTPSPSSPCVTDPLCPSLKRTTEDKIAALKRHAHTFSDQQMTSDDAGPSYLENADAYEHNTLAVRRMIAQ